MYNQEAERLDGDLFFLSRRFSPPRLLRGLILRASILLIVSCWWCAADAIISKKPGRMVFFLR